MSERVVFTDTDGPATPEQIALHRQGVLSVLGDAAGEVVFVIEGVEPDKEDEPVASEVAAQDAQESSAA